MLNYRARIYFRQRGQSLPMSLLIQGEVPCECLFDDPASRALESLGKAVELAGEVVWDVCCYNSIAHR